MKVSILGCGPAGLLAAKAVQKAGHTPTIFSRKVKSTISGAQYLARPIEGVTDQVEEFEVTFILAGSGDIYTARLYQGQEVPVRSSWHNYKNGKPERAWGMQECYDLLWEEFEADIIDIPLSYQNLGFIQKDAHWTVSTIPRTALHEAVGVEVTPEEFPARHVWIRQGDPVAGKLMPNTVWYNGIPDGSTLYRMSNIQGITSAEYTRPVPDGIMIKKPIGFQGADPFPGIFKVGRYGRWSKMQLAHHAYSEVLDMLVREDLLVDGDR